MKLHVIIFFFCSTSFFDIAICKCGKELKSFTNCYRDALTNLHSKNDKRVEFDDFEKKISKCFTSNGCSAVKLETEKQITNRSNSVEGDPNGEIKDESKFRDCQKKIRQAMRSSVEKCLQSKLDADFSLPEEKDSDYPKEYITRSGFAQEIWSKSVYQKIYTESVCPSKLKSDKKVIPCVENVFEEISDVKAHCKNSFAVVAAYDIRQRTLCEAGCFDKVKGDCLNSVNTSFPLGCKCNSEEYEKKLERYVKDFTKCYGAVSNGTARQAVQGALHQLDRFVCQPAPEDPCNKVVKTTKLF